MGSLTETTDNFLEREYFDRIVDTVSMPNFPWGFQKDVAEVDEDHTNHFYFVHRLYENYIPESSFFDELRPLLNQMGVASLIRMRLLLYVNQGKQIIHDRHVDKPYSHKASLLYLNTNNGFTEFDDDTRVDSIENRLVTFDGSVPHSSSTCTDKKNRLVLAINYF